MLFKGCATALITPFTKDGIDFEAYGRIIDGQINAGISALVTCGTTGEPATMTDIERRAVIEFAISRAAGHIPVIAGTGTNCTATTIERSIDAEKLGADALLIVTPYYNKCTQKGLIAHFAAIVEAVTLPIIIYNVPSRTGFNVLPETYAELAEIKNIAAIKEACGNLDLIAKTADLTRGKLDLYSGDDGLTYDIYRLGGVGVVSVASNVIPAEMVELCSFAETGKMREAEALQTKLQPLIKALFCEVNPIPVKAAAHMLGMCENILRLPLTPIEDGHLEELKAEMKALGY